MFIIHLISLMLIFVMVHRVLSERCNNSNWWESLDRTPGWSVCPRNNTYLKGFWRSQNKTGDERVGKRKMLRCCGAALRRSAFKMCECKLVTQVEWVSQTLLECPAFFMSHPYMITLINAIDYFNTLR